MERDGGAPGSLSDGGVRPLYHPFMMEGSGELVAAVNEMLLQSYRGVIEVFPAVPAGEGEPERLRGVYEHDADKVTRAYAAWDDCRFDGLLAVGAFEVSAERRGGRTSWVRIRSRAGGPLVLRNPFGHGQQVNVSRLGDGGVSVEQPYGMTDDGLISFDTAVGGEYRVYAESAASVGETAEALAGACVQAEPFAAPRIHYAHTGRRVVLGKDRDTDGSRLLDHFTFDNYAGNRRESRLAAYRLDFGVGTEFLSKVYTRALPR